MMYIKLFRLKRIAHNQHANTTYIRCTTDVMAEKARRNFVQRV